MLVRAGKNDSEILAGPEDVGVASKDWVEVERFELNPDDFGCFCVNDCGQTFDGCETIFVRNEEWACSEECAGEHDSFVAYENRVAAEEDFED